MYGGGGLMRQKQHETLKIIANTWGEDGRWFLSLNGQLFGVCKPRANAFQMKNISLFFNKELIRLGGIRGAREIFFGKSSESQAAMPTLSIFINKALYLYYKIGAVHSLMKGLF